MNQSKTFAYTIKKKCVICALDFTSGKDAVTHVLEKHTPKRQPEKAVRWDFK